MTLVRRTSEGITEMKKVQIGIMASLLSVAVSATSEAAPVTFTNEAAFLAAAASIPLSFEGLEGLVASPSPLSLGPITLEAVS